MCDALDVYMPQGNTPGEKVIVNTGGFSERQVLGKST